MNEQADVVAICQLICYNLHHLGRPINANLPGDDRPDLVEAL